MARSRGNKELRSANVLDAVMEEGKSNGIPTDYLREESANCRTSKDGNVCGDFRDLT